MPQHFAEPPRTVTSRLTAILLTFRSGSVHSLTEIAALTGLPMSTVHRLVSEMASWQLLRRTPDGRYQVGPNLQQLAGDAQRVPRLEERAALVVTDLCEATHRRVRLGVLRDDRVFYIEKRMRAEPPTAFSDAATLPPHATALGKALLAFAPRDIVVSATRNLTAYTGNTLTQPERLHDQLRLVRLTGIALGRGELVSGDWAIAAPVFGAGGKVVAALEVRVSDVRGDVHVCRPTLVMAARALSRELSLSEPKAAEPSWANAPVWSCSRDAIQPIAVGGGPPHPGRSRHDQRSTMQLSESLRQRRNMVKGEASGTEEAGGIA
ncbi:MAG TPA: IclR family transcriptional regulator [Blastococcus sp.]